MPKELEPIDRFNRMQDVVAARLKGDNPTQIAKDLGMKRAEVLEYIDEWQKVAQNSKTIQNKAAEAITSMHEHFDLILRQLWNAVEEADMNDDYKAKTSTLKAIADTEAKRVDLLQKAGLLDNQDIGAEIVETERKQKILVDILREVTSSCPNCRAEVARRLTDVTGRVETIIVN